MDHYQSLGVRDLQKNIPFAKVNPQLEDDLLIADCVNNKGVDILRNPCRFNGFLAFFCVKGRFTIEINLRPYEVTEGSLFIYTPGNVVRLVDALPSEKQKTHSVLIAVSSSLLANMRVDLNRIYYDGLRMSERPCSFIEDDKRKIFRKYIGLLGDVMDLDLPDTKDTLNTLTASVFSLMACVWNGGNVPIQGFNEGRNPTRTKLIFEEFLRLVKENHSRERSLSFYADKLNLTPKYLSKLVRTVSGRSAHKWIDDFVILEAKNLLKFSDLSIKGIVYELNFPNQTTFYRFFKTQTGLTPSAYRKKG